MRINYIIVAAAVLLTACEGNLVTDPTASIDSETALNTARGVELALNGTYRSLQAGNRETVAYPDVYADNLDFTGTYQSDREFGLRDVSTSNSGVLPLWADAYDGINRANGVLAAIPEVSDLSSTDATLFEGGARFVRAMHYRRLVEWFGGVPLVLQPSEGVGEESLVARNTQEEVYAQIILDLEAAANLLPAARDPGRATKGAANAFLARAYLEDGKYTQARDKATALISDPNYSLVDDFASLFTTKHSAESIYEVHFTINNGNSLAFWFFPQELGGRWGFSPTEELYNLYGATDARRDASIQVAPSTGRRYINKYARLSTGDDDLILLRLAEMYLIRAEANARLAAPDATVLADINIVRNRAGATPVSVSGQANLLNAVGDERRLELAFEGHRFFDLRRLGMAQSKLQISADRLLLPIPQAERDVNPNLSQNTGY
ncbi:MAG: RagB/SusD family nutrient uptake outer membrane protein [Longimicrobiales bacterium]|nr:RagB/SusD family nutrient uptake outer membrane protein [Longimicrobiales bacterium]